MAETPEQRTFRRVSPFTHMIGEADCPITVSTSELVNMYGRRTGAVPGLSGLGSGRVRRELRPPRSVPAHTLGPDLGVLTLGDPHEVLEPQELVLDQVRPLGGVALFQEPVAGLGPRRQGETDQFE